MVQLSHPYMTTGKTIALTRWILLFNMLSWLFIAFLPRSKHLLISWLQPPSAVILEPPKIKSDTVFTEIPREYFMQKDINGVDLTEAKDIKKRWQEYTEELYKKDLHYQIIMML